MDSILQQLYLLFLVGALICILIGGIIGYFIGLLKAISIYRNVTNYIENDFIKDIKNIIKE